MPFFLIPWIAGAGLIALLGSAIYAAVCAINEYLEQGERAKARRKVRDLRDENDGDLRDIYDEFYGDMSPETRRLFREYL